MYGELASVRGVVDLTPQEALDQAEVFLARLGYTIGNRTATTVTAQRYAPTQAGGQDLYNLTVTVAPESDGGVRMRVRGNDQAGVREHQAEWVEWSESLPKRPEAGADGPGEQHSSQTADIPSSPIPSSQGPAAPSPPPNYQAPPPPPRQGSTVWRGTKLAFGGCVVMPILLLVGFVSCIALLGGTGEQTGSGAGEEPNEQDPDALRAEAAKIGDPVKAGNITWTVTRVEQKTELRSFGETKQGNFVIVDLTAENTGKEPVTVDSESLALLDDQGRTHETDTDQSLYVPSRLDLFLEQVNPGVTKEARVIFNIAPDAGGLILRAGDGEVFTDKNGYVDLDI